MLRRGPYEVLSVVRKSCKHTEEQNRAECSLVHALGRNALLRCKRNLRSSKLEPYVNDKFPFQSHRLRDTWVEKRFSLLDADGKPLEPSWLGCGRGIKTVHDAEDVEQHGPPSTVFKLSSCSSSVKEGLSNRLLSWRARPT